MKRLGAILLACALILGMSQCKKENTNTNAEGEPVHIVLKVDNDGQRCNLDPTTGAYDFTTGDILLVGYNGKKAGELTYFSDDEEFRGDITIEPYVTGQNLHFYYLNGESYTPNADGECTVDISDQRDGLPVLAYGVSNETFPSDTYSAHLQNKCALVKFELVDLYGGPGTYMDIVVTGMQNLMKINFQNNSISSDKFKATEVDYSNMRYTNGEIHLYHQTESVKWAILLPQDPVVDADYWVGYDIRPWLDNGYESFGVSLPQITPNASISQDLYQQNLKLEYDSYRIPEQTDPSSVHYFTVGPSTTVQFSPGNLQAVGTTESTSTSGWTWRFAAKQWEYIGNAAANNAVTGDGTLSTDGTVDLFCWSTSATNYGIIMTGYASTCSGDFNDWGNAANPFNLDEHNDWRTLTSDEWTYLFTGRTNVENRFAKAFLDTNSDGAGDVHGVIVLPDNYTHPSGLTEMQGINDTGATSWDANNYNEEQWAQMEANGAIFLPAAGYLLGANYLSTVGSYWSSTSINNSMAHSEYFTNSTLGLMQAGGTQQITLQRHNRRAVRLVRDVVVE